MAIVRDFTDPKGTRRLDNSPIIVSAHRFKPIAVVEYPSKIYLSLTIRPNNICGIFSLFFNNDVLDILVKNTNMYGALYY